MDQIEARLDVLAAMAEKSFLAGEQYRVLKALYQLRKSGYDISPALADSYLNPFFTARIQFPVSFKGKIYICLGYRVRFGNPDPMPGHIAKGGIRCIGVDGIESHNTVSARYLEAARRKAVDSVYALGLGMFVKNMGVDFSRLIKQSRIPDLFKKYPILASLKVTKGGKGEIVAPGRTTYEPDHNEFAAEALKQYAYHMTANGVIDPRKDVPAGDMGTTGSVDDKSVMDWFVDGHAKALEDMEITVPWNQIAATVTGKTPGEYLGNEARAGATGFGTVELFRIWAEDKGKKICDLKVIFDGAGNAALGAAKLLLKKGVSIIGMTDSRSVIYAPNGLTLENVQDIERIKLERKSLGEWVRASHEKGIHVLNTKEELWHNAKIGALFLSSREGVININNVYRLPESIGLFGGGNGTVTPLAENVLPIMKIEHPADICTNNGGVTVSNFEWAGNMADFTFPKEEAEYLLTNNMHYLFDKTKKVIKDNSHISSLSDAFYYFALERALSQRQK